MLRALMFLVAVAAAVGGWLFMQAPHYLPTQDAPHFKAYWTAALKSDGAEKVMERLQKEFAHDDPSDQHYAFHIMGEILFREYGLSGIGKCTADYGHGCYHGFFTAAIGSLGEPSVEALDKACLSLGGGLTSESCQHGVGHGILEYVGPQRLDMALQWCREKVADLFPALGCKSGVFMEYFNPQLEPDRGPVLDPAQPLNICRDLPVESQRTCVYELSVLWNKADLPPTRIDEICAALPDERVRESCYIGYGNFITPEFNFSIEKAGALCDAMSPHGAALCRAGIGWSLSQQAEGDRVALACAPLSAELQALCLEKANFLQ